MDTKDYYLKQVAQGASKDSDYQYIIPARKGRLETKEINNNSEARKI